MTAENFIHETIVHLQGNGPSTRTPQGSIWILTWYMACIMRRKHNNKARLAPVILWCGRGLLLIDHEKDFYDYLFFHFGFANKLYPVQTTYKKERGLQHARYRRCRWRVLDNMGLFAVPKKQKIEGEGVVPEKTKHHHGSRAHVEHGSNHHMTFSLWSPWTTQGDDQKFGAQI